MNPYEVLGVPRDAGADAVARAYRKLATKLHPDKPGGSREKFEELKLAVDVLLDPDRRARYDSTGAIEETAADNELFKGTVVALTGLLQKCSQQAIQSLRREPHQAPLRDMMLKEAKAAEAALAEKVAAYHKALERLGELSRRFSGPEGRPDLFAYVITNQLQELRALIAPMEESLAAMTAAREYLEGCGFRQDEILALGGFNIMTARTL